MAQVIEILQSIYAVLMSLYLAVSPAALPVAYNEYDIMPLAAVAATRWVSVVRVNGYDINNPVEYRFANPQGYTHLTGYNQLSGPSVYFNMTVAISVPTNIRAGSTVSISASGFATKLATRSSSNGAGYNAYPWSSNATSITSYSGICYIYDQNLEPIYSFIPSSTLSLSFTVDHDITDIAIGFDINVLSAGNTSNSYICYSIDMSSVNITGTAPSSEYSSVLSTISSNISTMNSRVLNIYNSIGASLGTTVTAISNTLTSINTGTSGIKTSVDSLLSATLGIPPKLDSILTALQNISGGIISTPSQDQDAQDAVDRMDEITDNIDSMTGQIEQGTNRPPVSDMLPAVNQDILNPSDQSASFAVASVGSILEVSFVQTLLIFVVSLCFIRYVIFGRSN